MGIRTKMVCKAGDWEKEKFRSLRQMDLACFPGDPKPRWTLNNWWVLWADGVEAGYGAMRFVEAYDGAAAYMTRVGILPRFRGRGLQKWLVRARVRYAKSVGVARVVTYTICENHPSSNNLIKCGFRVYQPKIQWAGRNVIYWERKLNG